VLQPGRAYTFLATVDDGFSQDTSTAAVGDRTAGGGGEEEEIVILPFSVMVFDS
jgi:hypothetical protein